MPRFFTWWDNPKCRSVAYQALLLTGVICVGWFVISHTHHNLQRQKIASGFGFLHQEAGFAISESPIHYNPTHSYKRALWVGLLNTLKIAILGNFFAILIGTIIGIARLSKNWLVERLSYSYIETLRNVPLLLQLFFWYALLTEILPNVRQALSPLPGFFLSNRGLAFPTFSQQPVFLWIALASLPIIIWCLRSYARLHQSTTGKKWPLWQATTLVCIGLPIIMTWISRTSLTLDVPALRGFNFQGGSYLSPEFMALLFALSLYTAAFIAAIVRAGIQAIPKGQWEAGAALGFSRAQTLRLIILPQALRVIIPPLTSQMLNLTKNSSLAVAIAYPDFVAISNTSLNQTGQAIEIIALIMAVYLSFSLSTSVMMNWYNRRIALPGH